MYKPLCVDCTPIYRVAGHALLYLPPYLRKQQKDVLCYACGEIKEHETSVDVSVPRKVASYSGTYCKPTY